MSNRQSEMIGVTFEPVPEPTVRVPGEWILVFGVIYPAVVIGLELISHMCADAFFDPMPTYWHVAAVSLVPASNLLVWHHLQDETRANHQMVRVRQWRGDRHCRLLRAAVPSAAAARAGRHHRRDRAAAAGPARLLRVRAEARARPSMTGRETGRSSGR